MALFRERQVFTAVSKPEAEWSDNEREIMEEIRTALPLMKKRHFPSAWKAVLGYGCLWELMQVSENPDYFASGLPRQSAQHTLKLVSQSMWDFRSFCREYRKKPEKFTGKPSIPGYKRKGGNTTAVVTNQDCTIKTGTDGM